MPINMPLSDTFSVSTSKRKASKLLGEALLTHFWKVRVLSRLLSMKTKRYPQLLKYKNIFSKKLII